MLFYKSILSKATLKFLLIFAQTIEKSLARPGEQQTVISSQPTSNISASPAAVADSWQDAKLSATNDLWSMVASMNGNEGSGREDWLTRFEDSAGNEDERESAVAGYEKSNENQEMEEDLTEQHHEKKQTKNYDWEMDLDNSNQYRLSWRVSTEYNKITFSLRLDASQFQVGADVFALGFSERGETKSSDFCVIWYDLSHRIHLQDAQANADNILKLSDSNLRVCKLKHVREAQVRPLGVDDADEREDDTMSKSNQDEEISYRENINNALEMNTRDTTHDRGHKERWPHKRRQQRRANQELRELEIVFTRPLDVCRMPEAGHINSNGHQQRVARKYYTIDDGTTHLVWFKLQGPLVALDGLNLTQCLSRNFEKTINSEHNHQNDDDDDHSSFGPKSAQSGLKRVQLVAVRAGGSVDGVAKRRRRRRLRSRPIRDESLDIRVNQYKVPSQETTYLCKLFKLPQRFEQRRYHITRYEAVIEPRGNEQVVHHMELFNCANLSSEQTNDLDELYESQGGWMGDCGDSPRRPQATRPCKRVILAWAMGARPLVYPNQVGQSIGGRNYSPYVVLEIHYNNVDKLAGLLDSSGLRFHYSSQLRPFDAGVLEVGLEYTDKNSIPPKMVVPLAGHCVSECTRAAMSGPSKGRSHRDTDLSMRHDSHHRHHHSNKHPADYGRHQTTSGDGGGGSEELDGIYIFAAQMHTHLTGVASWTEHVRGGQLLGELQRDDHYSPHFQEIRLLPKPVHLRPGDALIHYCLYDTSQRTNITLGGFATNDEMCVTYLHYYPRIDLEVCKSSVDTKALGQYFARLARDENQATSEQLAPSEGTTLGSSGEWPPPAEGGTKTVAQNYHSIEWSAKRSRELLEFYSQAPLSVQCNRSNGDRWPGEWRGHQPTKVFWLDSGLRKKVEDLNSSSSSVGLTYASEEHEGGRPGLLIGHPAAAAQSFLDSSSSSSRVGANSNNNNNQGEQQQENLARPMPLAEYRGLGRHAQCVA